jgi:tetratricopeptide (TPR) repeat protein
MKKLSIGLFFVLIVIGCSSKSQVVLKDTDYLKYGTRAGVIEQAWGKPDETMAFQDYQAQSNYSFWGASGSWNRYGGSASGSGFSGTYTPTTIVWIYREKGYSLFFAQKGVFNEDPNPINIKIWKLVGWEKLKLEKTGLDDDKVKAQTPPQTTGTYKGQVISASEYNSRGFEYYKNAQYKQAIEDFTIAISMENNSSYYINRGCSFYGLKQYDNAISDFKQAINLAPNKATAYAWCGNVYYVRKSYYEASEYFSKAITIAPNDAVLYLNRGYAQSKIGNKSAAASDFKKGCELGNKDGCKELKVLENK